MNNIANRVVFRNAYGAAVLIFATGDAAIVEWFSGGEPTGVTCSFTNAEWNDLSPETVRLRLLESARALEASLPHRALRAGEAH